MKKLTDKAFDNLSKWNIRNHIDHHYNEYLSKGFVVALIASFIIGWKITQETNLSDIEGYQKIMESLSLWNLVGVPAAIIIFYYAYKSLRKSLSSFSSFDQLYKSMSYPIQVSLQLIGAVIILTAIYFFTNLPITHAIGYGRVFIFVSMAMYLYLIDFFVYSIRMSSYMKDVQLDE